MNGLQGCGPENLKLRPKSFKVCRITSAKALGEQASFILESTKRYRWISKWS